MKAIDIAKELLRDLDIFPQKEHADQDRLALEIDEFERGYPRMTLPLLIDIVRACTARAEPKGERSRKRTRADEDDADDAPAFEPWSRELKLTGAVEYLNKRIHAANPPGSVPSWRALQGRLSRLNRLRVFFDETKEGVRPLNYDALLRPGQVSVVDLSDTGFSELNNLVIADILRGIQDSQDAAYERFERNGGAAPTPVLIVVEEAHEFLSQERIDRTPVLFEQVAKICKRGRKRWLGLCFVTQLPAHLPKQVLGLCNSFVLHKLNDPQVITLLKRTPRSFTQPPPGYPNDPQVITLLKRTVGGVDEGLWDRLPNLAPGQAVVSFPHFARPLLVSIDPSQAKLRLVE